MGVLIMMSAVVSLWIIAVINGELNQPILLAKSSIFLAISVGWGLSSFRYVRSYRRLVAENEAWLATLTHLLIRRIKQKERI